MDPPGCGAASHHHVCSRLRCISPSSPSPDALIPYATRAPHRAGLRVPVRRHLDGHHSVQYGPAASGATARAGSPLRWVKPCGSASPFLLRSPRSRAWEEFIPCLTGRLIPAPQSDRLLESARMPARRQNDCGGSATRASPCRPLPLVGCDGPDANTPLTPSHVFRCRLSASAKPAARCCSGRAGTSTT